MATYRTDKTKAEIFSAFQNNQRVIITYHIINSQQGIQITGMSFQNHLKEYPANQEHPHYWELSSYSNTEIYLFAEDNDEYFYQNSTGNIFIK